MTTLISLLTVSMLAPANPVDFCSLLLDNIFAKDHSEFETRRISVGLLLPSRFIKYQLPKGTPPPSGWPVAFIFQGSFSPVKFSRREGMNAMGAAFEAELVQELSRQGFAVIAPRALGGLGWETNLPPFRDLYELSSDYRFMDKVLRLIENGELGPLDPGNIFATGISSGGYNASRMGIQFSEKFKALAVHSASYATCLGPQCSIPESLPATHPPTLLLTGTEDPLIPLSTVTRYHASLQNSGITSELYIKTDGKHEWFSESPAKIVAWFRRFTDATPEIAR